jgi:hypothetical protein
LQAAWAMDISKKVSRSPNLPDWLGLSERFVFEVKSCQMVKKTERLLRARSKTEIRPSLSKNVLLAPLQVFQWRQMGHADAYQALLC